MFRLSCVCLFVCSLFNNHGIKLFSKMITTNVTYGIAKVFFFLNNFPSFIYGFFFQKGNKRQTNRLKQLFVYKITINVNTHKKKISPVRIKMRSHFYWRNFLYCVCVCENDEKTNKQTNERFPLPYQILLLLYHYN